MTILNIIGSVLIGPLKLLFEVIFSLAYNILSDPGLAVIVLSLMPFRSRHGIPKTS